MYELEDIEELIENALAEDLGQADHTTTAILNVEKKGFARIIAKQSGILAGIQCARTAFSILDSDIHFTTRFKDGDGLKSKDSILEIEGKVSSILKSERTALNFLAHLSGISTLTSKYVEKIKGTKAKITDTRKTTPLMRMLEKEAVKLGGGVNHRMGLYDMVLIKENHIEAAGGIPEAVNMCKSYLNKNGLDLKIEVETTNLHQVREALECKVDQIMLDNMSINEMKESVIIIAGKAVVEASGGVSYENIKSIAETGVDLISVGALTHSAPVFDFSLLIEST